MTMGDVLKKLIEPLEARFKFDKGEEKAAKEDMVEAFKNFDDDMLAAAAKKIRMTREYKTMPTVGEIAKVLADLSYADKPAADNVYRRKAGWEAEWAPEVIRKANKLIQSELGRRAAREGWITGLHDYCRKKGKLPSDDYSGFALEAIVREMKKDAEVVNRTAAGVGFKPINPKFDKRQKLALVAIQGDLRKLGDDFLEKREKLAKIALGETGLDEEGNPTGPAPKGPDPYLAALEATDAAFAQGDDEDDEPDSFVKLGDVVRKIVDDVEEKRDGLEEPPPWQPDEGRA